MATAIKNSKISHFKLSDKQNSFNDLWKDLLDNYSAITAVVDDYSGFKLTYKELYNKICLFSAGLQDLGLNKGDHVSIFSENSSKWLITDQAILMAGGVNAVRGSQAPAEELLYILEHSDSKSLIVENLETFNKVKEFPLDFVICLSDEEINSEISKNYDIYSFNQIISCGKQVSQIPVEISRDDVATIVYTSGTTNKPKGVMLTNGNLLSQLGAISEVLEVFSGKTSLNMLPTWHIYERTCEYFLLSCGVTLHYTNTANFKTDIKRYNPNYIITVPRIWEAVYNGIQAELRKQPVSKQKFLNFLMKHSQQYIKSSRIANFVCVENIKCSIPKRLKAFVNSWLTHSLHSLTEKLLYKKLRLVLGKNFELGICGGGALAGNLEDFYEAAGIGIIVGYGLTETSPVLTFRDKDNNLKLSVGKPLRGTEIKIVNPETGKKEGYFKTGVVMAKGAQVMKGYYKNPKATAEVLSKDGWLNTGDLGWLTPKNDLVLTGRHKDLIVLSNGENIEPQPLESVCLTSNYVDQIMLIGQDKNHLGALICPNVDFVKDWAKKQSVNHADSSHIYHCPEVQKLFKKELNTLIQKRAGFRDFERINRIKLIKEPFTIENGLLTRTMKVKKAEIQKKYELLIEEMFKK